MTAPTVVPEVVVAEPAVTVEVFKPNRLVFMGLAMMVGALAFLLFTALREKEQYREAIIDGTAREAELLRERNETRERAAHTSNGKYDGPVTPPSVEETVQAENTADDL